MAAVARAPRRETTREGAGERPRDRRPLFALVLVTIVGAALRLSTAGQQSYWYDEAFTVGILRRSFGGMLERIPISESTPPLYYILGWGWTRVFGFGELGVRSLSALLGTLTIPVAYLAARRLAGRRVALATAVLAACNPFLIWYSQEARAYALMVLLGAVSFLLFLRALERPGGRRFLWWALVSAVALTAHYFSAFLTAVEAVWLLAVVLRDPATRHLLPRLLGAFALVATAAAALLPLLSAQNDGRARSIATEGSLPYRVGRISKEFVLGFDAPAEQALYAVTLVLLAAAIVLVPRRAAPAERRAARLAAAVGLLVILLATAVSAVATDYLNSRNVLTAWVPLAIFVSVGIAGRGSGRAGRVVGAGLVLLGLIAVMSVNLNHDFQRDNWRGAVESLPPADGARAIVIRNGGLGPVLPYEPRARLYPRQGARIQEIDVLIVRSNLRTGRVVGRVEPLPEQLVELPGFRLADVRRVEGATATRYLAPRPTHIPPKALAILGGTSLGATLILVPAPGVEAPAGR